MNSSTAPQIDYSKYGATESPTIDYSKYGATEPAGEGTPSILDNIENDISGFSNHVANDISEAPQALLKNPERTAQNVGVGLSEMGQDLLNAPSYITNLLRSEFPQPKYLSGQTSKIPSFGNHEKDYKQFFGVENQQPGDVTQQDIVRNANLLIPSLRAIEPAANAAVQLGKTAVGAVSGENAAKAAADAIDIPSKEAAVNASIEASEKSQSAYIAAQDQAQSEGVPRTPPAIINKINETQAKHLQLGQDMDEINQQLTSSSNPSSGAIAANQDQVNSHLNQAQDLADSASHDVKTTKDDLISSLNPKVNHDVANANLLQDKYNAIYNGAKKDYADIINKVKDNDIQTPEPAVQKQSMDLADFQKQNHITRDSYPFAEKVEGNENPFAKQLSSLAPTSNDTKLGDFLDKFKDFRDARHDLVTNIGDVSSIERTQRFKAFNDSQEMEDNMRTSLENSMGENADAFKKVNSVYKNFVYPLKSNEHVRAAYKGKLPANMIDAFASRGQGDVGKGQELVRGLVKNDPEMLKNVLGQKIEKKGGISKLLNPNQDTQEYLNASPDIKSKVDAHRAAIESQNNAKQNLLAAQENKKLTDPLYAKLAETQAQIKTLEDEMPKLQKHLDILNARRTDVKLTSVERKANTKALLQAKSDIKNNINKRQKFFKYVKAGGKLLMLRTGLDHFL